jgi:hypothetical protein
MFILDGDDLTPSEDLKEKEYQKFMDEVSRSLRIDNWRRCNGMLDNPFVSEMGDYALLCWTDKELSYTQCCEELGIHDKDEFIAKGCRLAAQLFKFRNDSASLNAKNLVKALQEIIDGPSLEVIEAEMQQHMDNPEQLVFPFYGPIITAAGALHAAR